MNPGHDKYNKEVYSLKKLKHERRRMVYALKRISPALDDDGILRVDRLFDLLIDTIRDVAGITPQIEDAEVYDAGYAAGVNDTTDENDERNNRIRD